ncbi:MAG: B12-binding domain-containing radical SAM protein [Spirochaetales bacterium]|nr:B12-binding domain-containing radical SAM protein [Spirochaetales bacterium]
MAENISEVLLVHPSEFFSGYAVLRNFAPTHLLLLGTSLKQENIPVKICTLLEDVPGLPQDLKELSLYYKKLVNYFKKYDNVGFVGISSYSSNYYIASCVIAHAVREALPNATIIVGGYGPNTTTEDYLFEGAPFDYVLVGEADIELPKLIKKIANGSKEDRFPGKYGKPHLVQCPEIQDLDTLPLIDWTLLEGTTILKQPTIIVPYYASRGCPFNCKYCCDLSNLTELGYHKHWRPKSVANVLTELKALHQFMGSKRVNIFFNDPLFGFKRDWKMDMLTSFADLTKDWKYNAFWIEERVDTLSEESVRLYTRIDMAVSLGFENGSPKMLRLMNKTQSPEKYLRNMIANRDLLEGYKVHYATNVLFGFPGETQEELIECQNYISDLFHNVRYGFPIIEKFLFYPGSYVYINAHTPEFKEMEVLVPDWYKRMGNTVLLPGLISPSKQMSYLEVFKRVKAWCIPLYESIIKSFSPTPNGKIVFHALKTAYLERFLLGWKFRPEQNNLFAEICKDKMPQLMPLGKDFPDFIKNAENKTDEHLEAMKQINIKMRQIV